WTERYAYDPAGNITDASWPTPQNAQAPDADARGEREYAGTLIHRAGNIRYQHDAQGRVTQRQQKRLSAKPHTWHYTWDADDRLTAVTTSDGQHWHYHYDPLGRRIAKQRLGADGEAVAEQVDFTWDGRVLAEQVYTDGPDDPGWTTVWEWEPDSFRPVSQTERVPLRDAPQEWVDEQFYAIVTDLIGTPTELVAPDGTLAWRAHMTLWGTSVAQESRGTSCPWRFPGQYHDPEVGLNYNYFRYYDPTNGRYGSSDPLRLVAGPNPHTYVLNPTGWIDPLGLQSCWENANRHTGPSTPAGKLTASQQRDMAKFLGLKPQPGRSKGQPIFTDGKRFYSYDVDGHNGGLFKVANSPRNLGKDTREGTLGLGREAGTNNPWELYGVGP
ncbi:MAG: toxin C-terminal domain-containing protein, partial [Actinobacteria bacterium]|nr:toxin C-terminal domain-containing protein [Actinomycetota bacterium]